MIAHGVEVAGLDGRRVDVPPEELADLEERLALRPYSTGGNYLNFELAKDDAGGTAAAYGRNLARLRRIKAEYDPGNLFRVNRNVEPAAA